MSDSTMARGTRIWIRMGNKIRIKTQQAVRAAGPCWMIGIGIVVAILCTRALGGFDFFENQAFDIRTRILRRQAAMPQDVVVILIDEASLAAMEPVAGRWPWPRSIHADLIDFLTSGGARKIIFDILFTEAAGHSSADRQQDGSLVDATQRDENVVHACQLVRETAPDPAAATIGETADGPTAGANDTADIARFAITEGSIAPGPPYDSAYWPFESLCRHTRTVGVTSFAPDADGVFRRTELLFRFGRYLLPGLSLTGLFDQSRHTRVDPSASGLHITMNQKSIFVPLGPDNLYRVNPYGRYTAYAYSSLYLSYARLMQGDMENLPVRPEEFKDKVVFIGASAAGVGDLKTTSLGTQMPGVLLHAAIYGNIATGDMLYPLPGMMNSLLVLLAVIATCAVIFSGKRISIHILLSVGLILTIALGSLLLQHFNRLVETTPALFGVAATYFTAFTWISFSNGREKRKIRGILGQYVSPAILATVIKEHGSALLDAQVGQRERLTLLFSDIRGFTTIAEQHAVEHVVALLNRYLEAMVDVIFQYQGTLDKFIGDAFLAFWGAPVRIPDHAHQAVSGALAMQAALKALNQRNHDDHFPRLQTGIGIHTDEVILGNIGSRKKLDYTVIGDGVNLTARLEGLTKFYQCPNLLSEETFRAVEGQIHCRLVDYVCVKGKDKPTMIYTATGPRTTMSTADMETAELSMEGFRFYRNRQFSEAGRCYRRILKAQPRDHISRLFIQRCEQFQQQCLQSDWQGEYVFSSK